MKQNQYNSNPVRKDSHRVMQDSEYVSINDVSPVIDELTEEEFEVPSWDAPVFLDARSNELEDVIRYFLVGNALNFCFNSEDGRFKLDYLGTEWDGAFAMWAGLKKAYENEAPILESDWLTSVTHSELVDVFAPSNGVSMPLPEKRIKNLHSLGTLFADLESQSGKSLGPMFSDSVYLYQTEEAVVPVLTSVDAYEDTRSFNGQVVRFDKRAQLAVCMLYGALKNTAKGFDTIQDVEEFTLFADYGIPAYLSSTGVLENSPSLEDRIKSKEPIEEGSQEEIEIRAATVVAGDRLQTQLSKEGYPVSVPILDYLLWSRRKQTETHPHITFTDAY
jgi:hypothetical protein